MLAQHLYVLYYKRNTLTSAHDLLVTLNNISVKFGVKYRIRSGDSIVF